MPRLDLTPPSLHFDAERLVRSALEQAWVTDPALGPDLSRIASSLASIQRRHGIALQRQIASCLRETGRFDVFEGLRLKLGRRAPRPMDRTSEPSWSERPRTVEVDLIVHERLTCNLAITEVKRGLGKTDPRKRRQIEADLLALRDIAPAYLRQAHGLETNTVRSVVIDVFGRSQFPRGLCVRGAEIDAFFQADIFSRIEAATCAVNAVLTRALTEGRLSDGERKLDGQTAWRGGLVHPYATELLPDACARVSEAPATDPLWAYATAGHPDAAIALAVETVILNARTHPGSINGPMTLLWRAASFGHPAARATFDRLLRHLRNSAGGG